MLWVLICTVHLTVCYYHVTYAFQSASRLYRCLNVTELFSRNRRGIWSLSDCNGTGTHNHLVRKQTLNHLVKLTNDWAMLRVLICKVHLIVCYYHVTFVLPSDIPPVLRKEFLYIQATIECGFTLNRVHDMIITYRQTLKFT